jgi:thiol-disulfide isomerase/thioredoxin
MRLKRLKTFRLVCLFTGENSLNHYLTFMKIITRITVLLLAQILLFSCSAQNEEVSKRAVPAQASADSLTFLVYEKFADLEPLLHRQSDTTYVVNFWATWCKPCVAELPFFEKLHAAYRGKPVEVILVSIDFPKQLKSKLLPFVRERNLQAQVVALADTE